MSEKREVVDHYSAQYRDFAAAVYAEVRREAFGDDIGQNSWLTRDELERLLPWLALGPSTRLLDVACGSGGPALRIARETGCAVVGVDLFEEAVANGNQAAAESGLEARATFIQADAGQPLPFENGSFDAILCIDAINHLPARPRVVADWARLLRPGGRLLFTDPVVVTGAVESDEIAIRASIGYFLFVPAGENERIVGEAGLTLLTVDDTTEAMAAVAQRRGEARAHHAATLRQVEGAEAFEGRERFFETAAALARERRLSRLAYVAEKAY